MRVIRNRHWFSCGGLFNNQIQATGKSAAAQGVLDEVSAAIKRFGQYVLDMNMTPGPLDLPKLAVA